MGPFGTTAAAFVGPVLPPHLAGDAGSAPGSGAGSAVQSGAGSEAGSGDEEEEAELLAQLRERAAQLRQLGGELPSGVARLVTEPESEPESGSGPEPESQSKQGPASESDPELDILAAIEAEVPPDAEPETSAGPAPAQEPEPEPTETEQESATSGGSRKRRRKARSRAAGEEGPPAKESRLEAQGVAAGSPAPADDLMAMIEAEQPPDYEQPPDVSPTAPVSAATAAAAADPAIDIISAIESELPPDYERAAGSPSAPAPAAAPAAAAAESEEEPSSDPAAAGDPMLDIISAIENELPPDYENPGRGQTESEEKSEAPEANGKLEEKMEVDEIEKSVTTSEGKPNKKPDAVKTKSKEPEKSKPAAPGRRRSRSVQGMGLIASYGSDSDSDSGSESDSRSGSRSGSSSDSDSDSRSGTDSGTRRRRRVRRVGPTDRTPPLSPRLPAERESSPVYGPALPPTSESSEPLSAETDTTSVAAAAPEESAAPPSASLFPSAAASSSLSEPVPTPAENKPATDKPVTSGPTTHPAPPPAAASYTTFSAGNYEAPTLQAQDGTCVGLGYQTDERPDRLAWEEAPQSDRPRRPPASDRRGFVQFQKGGTLQPPPEPVQKATETETAAAPSSATGGCWPGYL